MLVLHHFDSFVDYEIEASHRHLVAFEHALDIHNGKHIINESTLEPTIKVSISSHWRASVDLNEPRLEVSIYHEIIAIELKGIPAWKDALLDWLQRSYNDILYLCEAPVDSGGVVAGEEIVFEFVNKPLPAPSLVVVLAVLLDLNVRQVRLCFTQSLHRLSMF